MRQRLHALWVAIKEEHSSPERIAAAVFVGINLGVWPVYGIQTVLCLAAASVLRLNKLTVILAAHISNPLFAPFLVAGGIVIGEWIRFGTLRSLSLEEARDFLSVLSIFAGEVPSLFVSCFVGSLVLGLAIAVPAAGVTYLVARNRTLKSLPEDPGTGASEDA
ncbi:MAG: DUF2062 domain-containing protein [Myxococcales bacterium]|nr:DUF2062 domain-containing protein [Myxococcales bacterium]